MSGRATNNGVAARAVASTTSARAEMLCGLHGWLRDVTAAMGNLDRLRRSRLNTECCALLIGALRQETDAIDRSIAALLRLQSSMRGGSRRAKSATERRLQVVSRRG